MSRIYSPPTKLTPAYKFGETVCLTDSFYGHLVGTVGAVAEQELGFFLWKKHRLIYQIEAETDSSWITVYAEESCIKPYAKLRPVK